MSSVVPETVKENIPSVDFVANLYPRDGVGWFSLWELRDKTSKHFNTADPRWRDRVAAQVAEWDGEGRNVFFGVGLRSKDCGEGNRGTRKEVAAIPGFWLDIDIKGPGHADNDRPPDIDAAVEKLLATFGTPPSLVVHSGGGLHVYYLFDKPLIITDDNRSDVQAASKAFQGSFIERAKAEGWKLDNTSDLARVLRPAGSFNRKTETPRPVVILGTSVKRYSYDELRARVTPSLNVAATAPDLNSAPLEKADSLTPEEEKVVEAARDVLRRQKAPDRVSIAQIVLDGRALPQGSRDTLLHRVASWIASALPDAEPEVLAKVLKGTLAAMAAENPGDHPTEEDVIEKIFRAQAEIRPKRDAAAAKEAAFMKVLKPKNNEGDEAGAVLPAQVITPEEIQRACSYQGCTQDELRRMVIIQPLNSNPWVFQPGGHVPCNRPDVGTTLFQTGFPPDFYSLFAVNRKGELKPKSEKRLRIELTEHAKSIVHDGTISRARVLRTENGSILHVPAAIPRKIEPKYHPEADRFVELFAGSLESAERLKDWIALCTDLSVPLPGIIALGEKTCGKTFFARALGALWVAGGRTVKADTYWNNFNSEVAQVPLLLADERGPQEAFGSKPIPSDSIRSFITEIDHGMNEKFGDRFCFHGHIRIFYALNDLENAHLVEDDATPQTLDAVTDRFLLLTPGKECQEFLAAANSEENGWLSGQEVLPRLFAWYRATRVAGILGRAKPKDSKFRVPGNAKDIQHKLEVRGRAQIVMEEIFRYLERTKSPPSTPSSAPAFVVRRGIVYLRISAVVAQWATFGRSHDDARRNVPTECALGKELQGIIDNKNPRPITLRDGSRPSYQSVRTSSLLDYAPKCGRSAEDVRKDMERLSAASEEGGPSTSANNVDASTVGSRQGAQWCSFQ